MINFYKLKKEYVTLEECSGLTLTASEMFNDQVVLVFGDVFTFLTSIYYYEEDQPIATNPAIIYDELIYENSYILESQGLIDSGQSDDYVTHLIEREEESERIRDEQEYERLKTKLGY